jgi:hypothetical protein
MRKGCPLLIPNSMPTAVTGFVEGQNVTFEFRDPAQRLEEPPALAADLVGQHVKYFSNVMTIASTRRRTPRRGRSRPLRREIAPWLCGRPPDDRVRLFAERPDQSVGCLKRRKVLLTRDQIAVAPFRAPVDRPQ